MGKNLEGRVALVTGGARGIGRAICEKLASEGATVAMVDIMLDVAEKTAAEFRANGHEAFAVAANVAKFEDAEAAVKAVVEKYGKLDILVNCAGITRDTLMLKMTEQDWDAVIAVNLKGVFNMTKAAIRPMMKARFGRIVNISSVVGRMGNVGQANYAASKAGVLGLTKTTAREFASRNITANAVCPGYIETEMLVEDLAQQWRSMTPMGHFGQTDDVGALVLFLASDAAAYMTGSRVVIDGGYSCI